MANPYALDFNPLASAISDNQQLDLARNRLAMDQKRLGFEAERLGFERDLQPHRITSAKLGNETAQQGLDFNRETQPYRVQGLKYQNEGQRLSNENLSQETERNLFKGWGGVAQSMVAEQDPVKRQAYLDQIAKHPKLSASLDKYLPSNWRTNPGLVGTWMDAVAQGHQDDMDRRLKKVQVESAESEATAMRDWRGTNQTNVPTRAAPTAVRTGDMGSATNPVYTQDESGRGIPPGTHYHTPSTIAQNAPPRVAGGAPGQVPSATTPQGPPPAVTAPMPPALQGATDGPLVSLRDQWVQAQRMLMGPKALWPAAEKTLDRINKELEKGVTIGRSGNVVPIPGAQESQARAKELETAAQERGKAAGTAQATLPDAERSAAFMLKKIQAIEDHPALGRSTGAIGGRTWAITPEAKDLQAKLSEVQGATFMQAFQSLRGGGQITEKEGEKATAALSRLQEQRVGTAEYVQALKDFKSEIMSLYDLAQKKAGTSTQPAPPAQGDIFRMDGVWYQYVGGDLRDPKSYKKVNR